MRQCLTALVVLAAVAGTVETASAAAKTLNAQEELRLRSSLVEIALIERTLLTATGAPDPSYPGTLQADIAVLKNVLPGLPSDGAPAIAAHYFIAVGDERLNLMNFAVRLPINKAAAKEAARNYDIVIAYGHDLKEWGVDIREALYGAGSNAYAFLKSEPLAWNYFRKCSAMGHAGCTSSLADELLAKPDATQQQLDEAYDLHRKISETGTTFRCAAIFSGRSGAMMVHFHKVERPKGEEFVLMNTLHSSFATLQKEDRTSDPCHGSMFMLDEYLMHADEGELRPELLADVMNESAVPIIRRLAKYLQGDTADLDQNMGLLTAPYSRCMVDFYRLWTAAQHGRRDAAQPIFTEIKQIGPATCRFPASYAQQLNQRLAQGGK
jgi:hypothetical protein